MEAAIRNGVRRKVLCLVVDGSFSERVTKIAAACGKEVVEARSTARTGVRGGSGEGAPSSRRGPMR